MFWMPQPYGQEERSQLDIFLLTTLYYISIIISNRYLWMSHHSSQFKETIICYKTIISIWVSYYKPQNNCTYWRLLVKSVHKITQLWLILWPKQLLCVTNMLLIIKNILLPHIYRYHVIIHENICMGSSIMWKKRERFMKSLNKSNDQKYNHSGNHRELQDKLKNAIMKKVQ